MSTPSAFLGLAPLQLSAYARFVGIHRNKENQFMYGWFGFGFMAMAAIVLLARPGLESGIAAAIAMLGGIAALRFGQAAAITDTEGVTVRQTFRSVHVPWSDIMRFRLKRRGLFPLIGILERTDGHEVPIYGIQAPNPTTRPENMDAQRVVLELNLELAAAKGVSLDDIRQPAHLPIVSELLANSTFTSESVDLDGPNAKARVRFKQLDIRRERPVKKFWPAQKVETPVVERILRIHGATDWTTHGQGDDDLADIQFDGSKVLITGQSGGCLSFQVPALHLDLGAEVPAGTDSHWDIA